MADFTTVMTGTAEVDDSIVKEYEKFFLLALAAQGVADQFVSYRREIGAESISLPKYDQLALATTPLTEKEDIASVALSDSKVVFTPAEYGNAVTTTKLANLQTAGMSDVAAAQMVGINAGRTLNRLGLLALDASTNIIYADGGVADATITATDVMSPDLMGEVFNKLARESVEGLPQAQGDYVMIAHDDVIHDLREGTAAGTWQDVHKYAIPGQILKNEVGMFKGFRVIRDNLSTLNADAGAGGTVDVYTSYFLGFNALGKAMSQDVKQVFSGPFDKLGRFVNYGWHGVLKYGIVEPKAVWTVHSASSVGANV